MNNLKRGIIKIKPVYWGIYHYPDKYGSVCVPNEALFGKWTPPVPASRMEELERGAKGMVEGFKKSLEVDFVEVEEPSIIKEHKDLRKLPEELTYDVDALLVGSVGNWPLGIYALEKYGLPLIRGGSSDFFRALRVKKFLSSSKFLYIGEFPSFSILNRQMDLFAPFKRFGVRVQHIETNEFYRHFDGFSDEEVLKELSNWKKDFDKVVEPSEEELMKATRGYLALLSLCNREDANGVAINCGRLTEERPFVPCMAFNRLIDESIMCSCEGDVTAMLSSLMLHAVSGQSVLMGNFGFRPGDGEVAISHGIIPLSMAKTGYTIRDYHGRAFGVTGYADIKTEPMTILNLDESLEKISIIEGTIKGSEDTTLCRITIHMSVDGDLKKVPQIIVGSQHASMTLGHWLTAMTEVGNLLGLEVRHP